MYLERKSCFFLIKKALFILKYRTEPSSLGSGRAVCTIIDRQISPLRLNLNLKPLYSIRGGSTTRAEPLTKNPSSVLLRFQPLYKWKT